MAQTGYDRRVNFIPSRNIYPFMSGGTLSQISGAQSNYHANIDATTEGIMNANVTSNGAETQPKGNPNAKPFLTWIMLLGLLLALMWGAQRFGTADQKSDFANIKLSLFNVLIIALAALIGTAGIRALFTRYYVPGLSEIVNT